jgi:hypothetical protein
MSTRGVLRAGLGLLAVLHLVMGIWAVASPRWFFDNFPGYGPGWTAAHPPYNEHLTVDLGATFVAFGALLALAVVLADRRVTAVVLVGLVVFGTVHLIYHLPRPGELTGRPLLASTASLVLGVLVPLGLLWLNRRTREGQVA